MINKRLRMPSSLLLLGLVLLLSACGTNSANGKDDAASSPPAEGKVVTTAKGKYTDITPDQFKVMLESKDFYHVDVHVPNEGKLPQIDARIPFDQITQNLDQLPSDKSAKIVLTCRSDRMSGEASAALADLGYTNVYNLDGGFNAWKDKGYPFTPEP